MDSLITGERFRARIVEVCTQVSVLLTLLQSYLISVNGIFYLLCRPVIFMYCTCMYKIISE